MKSALSKIWKLQPKVSNEVSAQLAFPLGLTSQLLYNRGIKDRQQAEEFLRPDYATLNSPYLFRDLKKAVERIWQAIEKDEKIVIYGDYDADAVTANALLRQALKQLGARAESYIPDRFTEGYGINLEALEKIQQEGAKLIVTVDCGTNSTEAALWCKREKLDLIVTDHHELVGTEPTAFALVNPKNPNDSYPYGELTGVGVAFKLAVALLQDDRARKVNPGLARGWEKWLLDLVAIGTVADCHSLLGENRTLVKFGLTVLPKTKWVGLRALCEASGLDFNRRLPDTYTLGFIVAPRLNAAGRLRHANLALNLLLEEDPILAREKAFALDQLNSQRQNLTLQVLSEARAEAELIAERKVIAVLGKDWPKGVVGLVAGKLVEEFRKPVLVLEKGEQESTGSARTVGSFDIIQALRHSSEYLVKFGGHKQAAGLTLKTEVFETFYRKLLEYAEENLTEEDLRAELTLEAELFEDDLNLETLNLLSAFEPFGVGNPVPKFLLRSVQLLSLKAVGGNNQHLQAQIKIGHKTVAAIGFNLSYFERMFRPKDNVDLAVELILDDWNGAQEVKLKLVDMRKALLNG